MNELQRLEQLLRNHDMDPNKLWVFVLTGGEQILGTVCEEAYGSPAIAGKSFAIKNPKRILRIQRMEKTGLTIELGVVDFDFIEGGTMHVQAPAVYRVQDLSEPSKFHLYQLIRVYIEGRREASAAQAGLTLPPRMSLIGT